MSGKCLRKILLLGVCLYSIRKLWKFNMDTYACADCLTVRMIMKTFSDSQTRWKNNPRTNAPGEPMKYISTKRVDMLMLRASPIPNILKHVSTLADLRTVHCSARYLPSIKAAVESKKYIEVSTYSEFMIPFEVG